MRHLVLQTPLFHSFVLPLQSELLRGYGFVERHPGSDAHAHVQVIPACFVSLGIVLFPFALSLWARHAAWCCLHTCIAIGPASVCSSVLGRSCSAMKTMQLHGVFMYQAWFSSCISHAYTCLMPWWRWSSVVDVHAPQYFNHACCCCNFVAAFRCYTCRYPCALWFKPWLRSCQLLGL